MLSLTRIMRPTAIVTALLLASSAAAADWAEVQRLKAKYLGMAAQHAMEQQRTAAAPPIAIPFPDKFAIDGGIKLTGNSATELSLTVTAAPKRWRVPLTEVIQIALAKPMDLVSLHSGLAFTIKTTDDTSPEVRIGCRLLGTNGKITEIEPMVPVRDVFGSNLHEIYLDWSFLNYANAEDAFAVLTSVKAIEITFGSTQRAPKREASSAAQTATFTLSNLRLVDYLTGSYDPSRMWLELDAKADRWVPGTKHDLTLQHRVQEVTGLVAQFGGEAGIRSAISSLDMCVRTQCWDGSFLDGRRGANTVASGEYTFGFTIYGTLCGYQALEKAKIPALDESLTVGPLTMTRREFYQRMFYRAAMSRTAATPADYRDDIIGGNTLMTGANRVLGYVIAMRMVAETLTDPAQKKSVMEKFNPFIDQIAQEQGAYSGGFPILGEGDMYGGRGIHYDNGYTRTHMDWLIVGAVRTGDPRLIQMLERYQRVFEAVMDEAGYGMVPLLSERHPATTSEGLILPDATCQVGLQYKLPIIAQWGYNCGMPVWKNWAKKQGNHFTYASHKRGYALGAHMSILADDTAVTPEPKDIGYLFPRQYPIWSSRLHTKEGVLTRTTNIYLKPDGTRISDFTIQVGEYPVTVGVPVLVKSSEGTVIATADALSGWPKLLPANAAVTISGDLTATGTVGTAFTFKLEKESHLVISGPDTVLPAEAGSGSQPFKAQLTLRPEKPGQTIELTVLNGTIGLPIVFVPPQVLQGLPAGANVACSVNGAVISDVNHRQPVPMMNAIDENLKNFCAIEELASASFRIKFAGTFPIDKIVIYSGQYGKLEERSFPRPKDISITVPGREPLAVTLADKPFEAQEFALSGASADHVKIDVRSVYPAAKAEVTWGGFAEIQVIKK